MWGFVLNLDKTGHVLGHGGGRVEQQASPSLTGSPTTAFRVLYRLLDLSGLNGRLLVVFVGLGIVFAVGDVRGAAPAREHAARGRLSPSLPLALPLLAPRLVPDVAPCTPPRGGRGVASRPGAGVDRGAVLLGCRLRRERGSVGVRPARRAGAPRIGSLVILRRIAFVAASRAACAALGLALPLVVVLLALTSKYNPWLVRFLLVPMALGAPLLAPLFRRREVALGVAIVAVAGAIRRARAQPAEAAPHPYGYAWQLTQADAAAADVAARRRGRRSRLSTRRSPESSCVGADLGSDEAAYPIFGAAPQS